MQCPECGFEMSNEVLRYCEECGAKLPPPSPDAIRRQGGRGGTSSGRAAVAASRAPAQRSNPRMQAVEEDEGYEDTNPGANAEPAKPPYDGPKWLEHIPGHSPTILGVALMGLAVVMGIIFSSVGPFWSLLTVAGGVVLAARELRATGEKHPLVDWVPESLHPPAFVVAYTVLVVALAVRTLGFGFSITPLLWVPGALLVAKEQYPKLFAGEEGYLRFFDPHQLLKGTRVVALVGVTICLLSLFLSWVKVPTAGEPTSARPPGHGAPSELRVIDAPRPVDDAFADFALYGWDQPFSVMVELLLLGTLGVLCLKPDEERPSWVRFLPLGGAALSLIWGLVNVHLVVGPVVFLAGLAAVAFVGVTQAIPPKAPEPAMDEFDPNYGGEGEFDPNHGAEGEYADGNFGDYDPNNDPNNNGNGNGGGYNY